MTYKHHESSKNRKNNNMNHCHLYFPSSSSCYYRCNMKTIFIVRFNIIGSHLLKTATVQYRIMPMHADIFYGVNACVIHNYGVNSIVLSVCVYADRYNMETIFTARFYYRDGFTSYVLTVRAILMHVTFVV